MAGTPSCPPCPQCGDRTHVGYTVKSDVGSYCRCQNCGTVWHVDWPALEGSSHRHDELLRSRQKLAQELQDPSDEMRERSECPYEMIAKSRDLLERKADSRRAPSGYTDPRSKPKA
jgi:transcription elongation factor Elf1